MGEVDERRFERFMEERQDLKPTPTGGVEQLGQEATFEQGVGGERLRDVETAEETTQEDEEGEGAPLKSGRKEGVPEGGEQGTEGETGEPFILTDIKVPENAEALPKTYLRGIEKIVNDNVKDPSRLVEELDKARWDLFWKAYKRRRGDGLAGGGA